MIMGVLALRGSGPSWVAAPVGGLGEGSEGVICRSCSTLSDPFIIGALLVCAGVVCSALCPPASAALICGERERISSG